MPEVAAREPWPRLRELSPLPFPAEEAACHGLGHLMFEPDEPERLRDRAVRERAAKKVCAGCPFLEPCREWALANNERFHVWGGMDPRERERERRRRRLAAREKEGVVTVTRARAERAPAAPRPTMDPEEARRAAAALVGLDAVALMEALVTAGERELAQAVARRGGSLASVWTKRLKRQRREAE